MQTLEKSLDSLNIIIRFVVCVLCLWPPQLTDRKAGYSIPLETHALFFLHSSNSLTVPRMEMKLGTHAYQLSCLGSSVGRDCFAFSTLKFLLLNTCAGVSSHMLLGREVK